MRKLLFIPFLLLSVALSAQSLSADYLNYIEKYKQAAVDQEIAYKIPACITLAQGLLESGAGKSSLATTGNNHFGIKCHNDWAGDTILWDDDQKNDCFRKYEKAEDSFEDHAKFLLRKRYQPLFELDITDYKGWARGLKSCGYATDPNYATKLIKLIDDYDLVAICEATKYSDASAEKTEEVKEATAAASATAEVTEKDNAKPTTKASSTKKPSKKKKSSKKQSAHKKTIVDDAFADAKAEDDAHSLSQTTSSMGKSRKINPAQVGSVDLYIGHKVYHSGLARYVIAEAGDTYKGIAAEFNIELSRIFRYNGADENDKLTPGERVYLNRKKR